MSKTESQPSVSIALCTYNGAKFISEQIQSLTNQTILPFEVVVCDDVSSDNTIEILHGLALEAPFTINICRNDLTIGVVKNFSKAISLCKGDYIALSDQDDIWLPDKIEASLKRMREIEKEYSKCIPILVYSDLTVVDENRQVINPSYIRYQRLYNNCSLKYLIMQNCVTGCCCMINRALADEAVPIPDGAAMHDWWLALIASSRGKIEFIERSTILYRQHNTNVVGAKISILRNIRGIFKKLREGYLDKLVLRQFYQALELKKYLVSRGMPVPQVVESYVSSIKKGGISSAYKIYSTGMRNQWLLRDILFFILIALKRYKRKIDLNCI